MFDSLQNVHSLSKTQKKPPEDAKSNALKMDIPIFLCFFSIVTPKLKTFISQIIAGYKVRNFEVIQRNGMHAINLHINTTHAKFQAMSLFLAVYKQTGKSDEGTFKRNFKHF